MLPGGAARGAYEVGVVRYVLEEVARDLGREVQLDILCGTSIGAFNACVLAAFADEPRGRGARLEEQWTSLKLEEVLRPDAGRIAQMVLGAMGLRIPWRRSEVRLGGVLEPRALDRVLREEVPFERIGEHLRAGRLQAVTVSTTHVASGNTVVFLQQLDGAPPRWAHDPTLYPRAAQLAPEHVLASAAIPLLFPAVRIGGELFCEGGLRQNVPLVPALRLGASRLLAVSPHHVSPEQPAPATARRTEEAFADPLFLIGKTLNALLLDRIDNDVDRLDQINQILEAGERRFGPAFLRELNQELDLTGGAHQVRPVRVQLIRASSDIGQMSADYVRSRAFSRRHRGPAEWALRRLADAGETAEADLLSYVLFDGAFARQLIELGWADARAQHSALCGLFASSEAEEVGE